MKTILVPIDFSRVSDAVVHEAVSLARSLKGRVVLLSVVQPPMVETEYAGLINFAELAAAGAKNARRQLKTIEGKVKKDLAALTTLQVAGSPVAQILEQADACRANYIVMGSHGHTAFYDLLVGSTTHGVLKRAKCPVVIVPAITDAQKTRKAKELVAST
ncbi:MAG: universal stress protein [Opitutus sp.]